MISQIKNKEKIIESIKDKLGNIIYEAWKRLPMSGIPPLTLPKCKGVDLVDYKIYGNNESVGDKTNNLCDEKLLGQEEGYNTYENGIWTTSSLGSYGRDIFYNIVGTNHSVDVSKVPKVKPNTTITVKFYDYINNGINMTYPLYIGLYDNEGTFISRTTVNPSNVFAIEIPENIHYITFFRSSNYGTISFSHIQIVEGSYTEATIPDYEPYGYKIPITVSKPNIYKFEDFFSSGTSTRYVSKIDDNSIKITDYYQCIFTVSNTLFKPNTTYEVSKKLNVISGTSTNTTSRMVLATGRTSGGIYIIQGNQSTNEFTTPDDLSDYIYLWVYGIYGGEIDINDIIIREKGTLTTNIYLDEPLKENEYISFSEDNLPPIPTFKGTTIIEVDTTIQPSNMEVQYYGKEVA